MFSYIKALLGKKNILGISNPLQLNFESEYPNEEFISSTNTTSLLGSVPSTQTSIGTVTASSIYAPHHLNNFQLFKDQANKAFDGAFPKKSKPRYTKVKVLLLRWEDDDLGVISELNSLRNVLGDTFHFKMESWNIPGADSEDALTKRVLRFRKNATTDQLLIVYYGGHADRANHDHCIWRCRCDESSPTLDWSLIQPFLLTTVSDTLVLLDCCFAARGGKDRGTPSQTTNEIIAACSSETPTTGVERRSFTSAMTRELELLAHKYETHGTRFTAVSLHSALFRYDRELRYTPFYVRLTDHECMSIDLTPLPPTPGTDYPVELMGSVPATPQSIMRLPECRTRVLLAINTTRTPRGDLVAFLRSEGIVPEYVSSMEVVKVEAVYKSRSTLTLVSVPMEIWHLLPQEFACVTVGIVTSDNLLQNESIPESRVSQVDERRSMAQDELELAGGITLLPSRVIPPTSRRGSVVDSVENESWPSSSPSLPSNESHLVEHTRRFERLPAETESSIHVTTSSLHNKVVIYVTIMIGLMIAAGTIMISVGSLIWQLGYIFKFSTRAPKNRTTFGIISSSMTTMSFCASFAIYWDDHEDPDLPSVKKSSMRIWQRVPWVLVAFIAPEIVCRRALTKLRKSAQQAARNDSDEHPEFEISARANPSNWISFFGRNEILLTGIFGLQFVWMVVQYIARIWQKLPVAPLESLAVSKVIVISATGVLVVMAGRLKNNRGLLARSPHDREISDFTFGSVDSGASSFYYETFEEQNLRRRKKFLVTVSTGWALILFITPILLYPLHNDIQLWEVLRAYILPVSLGVLLFHVEGVRESFWDLYLELFLELFLMVFNSVMFGMAFARIQNTPSALYEMIGWTHYFPHI